MAKEWWEDDPIAGSNSTSDGWWSSDPIAPESVTDTGDETARLAARYPAPKPERSRSVGEVAADTGLSALQGAMGFAQLPGTVYGLVSGKMDNEYSQFFQRGIKAADELKSDVVSDRQKALQQRIDQEDSLLGKFKEGIVGTITDPVLALDQAARMVPSMAAGAGLGSAIQKGLQGAAGVGAVQALTTNSPLLGQAAVAASRAAAVAPTATAVGTAALEQGQDVGYDTLDQAKRLPLELWAANDAGFQQMVAQGVAPEDARDLRANEMARTATGLASLASLVTQALPGGRAIETAFVPKRVAGGRILSGVTTGVKEGVLEGAEEGLGSAAKDVQLSGVDPTIDVLGNAAGAAGMGAGLGGPMGAVAGALSPRTANFTPPDSPAKAAGLPDIVVPVPTGAPNVSTPGDVAAGTGGGSQPAGDLAAGGVPPVDGGGINAGGGSGGGAGGMGAMAGAPAPAPAPAGQPASGVARRDGLATDASLLSRLGLVDTPAPAPAPAPAAAPSAQPQEPRNERPVDEWTGRSGNGYSTLGDAQTGMATRVKRLPMLSWQIEQMPSGKFKVVGYAQEVNATSFANMPVVQQAAQDAEATRRFDLSDKASYTDDVLRAIAANPQAGPMLRRAVQLEQQRRAGVTNPMPPAPGQSIADRKRQDNMIAQQRAASQPMELKGSQAPKPLDWREAQQRMQAVASGNFVPADRAFLNMFEEEVGADTFRLLQLEATQPFRLSPADRVTLRATKERLDAKLDQWNKSTGQPVQTSDKKFKTAKSAKLAQQVEEKRAPNLSWRVEGLPDGTYRLAAYPKETTNEPNALANKQEGQPAQSTQRGRADEGQSGAQPTIPSFIGGTQQEAEKLLQRINDKYLKRGKDVRLRLATPPQDIRFGAAMRFAQELGRPMVFVEISGKDANWNAIEYNGVLLVNVKSKDFILGLAAHEGFHSLPADIRKAAVDAIMQTVTPEQRAQFLKIFKAYADDTEVVQNEEIAARIIEQDAQNEGFWQAIADRMGDGPFSEFARAVMRALDRLLAGSPRDDSNEFTTDIQRVREIVADAYAQAMERQGMAADGDIRPSIGRKREQVGDYQVAPAKDGSLTVLGDPEEIRALMPDNVKGRVVKEGVAFTSSDAPRVRAALEGRQVAYSRAGQVVDKLPMKDGKYLGAPPGYDTPAKIPTLRKLLMKLTLEGERGRFWYENSSKAILRMAGSVDEARRFVALLAIYSPQAKVDTNSTFALRAWAQYKAGQPISVKTKVMDQKATDAMRDVEAFWSGEKTGNFFNNLLREIDPTTAGKQGATIDMWMMRAGQYPTDAPTKTQYAFMENENNRIAAELGWEPQQVQAAIWVAMKARMENKGVKQRTEASSEKKGWIRFDKDAKGKKVRVVLDKQKHRDNWLKHAMAHTPTDADTQAAKFDFEDGVMRHIGQVSFEARPGRSSGVLPGIHDAPYEQQVEFHQAVQQAFYDDRGVDMLAAYLGLLADNDILAPGVWQGEVSPSTQKQVSMAPALGDKGKTNVDPAQAKLLNIYAAVAGLVARQEGVGWHRPFYASRKSDANGLDIDIGRPLTPDEAIALENAVGAWMQRNNKPDWQGQFAFVSSPKGIRLVNFGIITNGILQTEIVKVAESVLPDGSVRVFASDGDMPTNDWKENPNGQAYIQRIGAEGRPDVLDWARTVLAPRVQRVFDDFSDRYGWGDPGEIRFSVQRDRGGRGAGRELAPLEGAPNVQGASGPDPRLVQVAEQYARDNGIALRRQSEYVQVDEDRSRRIAAAYDAMPHAPQDPRVKEAYQNLIRQTLAQYRALEKAGYKFYFFDETNDPYEGNPWDAMRDLRQNQVMGVFASEAGFGSGATELNVDDNPLLADTGIEWPYGGLDGEPKRVLANDLFRAVHDAFGHGLEGAGFRAQGEENAWQAHVRLFTGSAVGAITSETRGQNSWLNYGPYGEQNRNARVEDTVFADQKTGLMPAWTWTEGVVGDMPAADTPDLTGRKVSYEVRVEDTGETATLTVDAKEADAEYNSRVDSMRKLLRCLG